MNNIVNKVISSINESGLVLIEVSARHIHLTREHCDILFGKDYHLKYKRDLSQPGQYLCEERVTLIGPKGKKDNVAILGPLRKDTQVELSKSDCIALGVKAPVRLSGDVKGSGSIILEGPCGRIEISEGVIIAKAHIHITPEIADSLSLKNNDIVMVEVLSDRPLVYKNVSIRVDKNFAFRMHVDFDEANAAEVSGFTLGKIIHGH